MSGQPIAPGTLIDVTQLLDDLAQLVDVAAANAEADQRHRAVSAASEIRLLRAQLCPPTQNPPGRTPGRWYARLAAAFGDVSNLPHAALIDRIDQLEQSIDRTLSLQRRRWWRANRR
ncbi:hypothetical protein [Phytohabitans rumicis]|uniref:Uncharacterized protein n=1 Tax=Phytohabitans rumicis TaxID=1076125 RepID=A0A6V8L7G2_9ACTN|nr:hypothetical protein [Phytohabitans rumicis]GFJ93193.1 hypothetical protein Prum_068350 [Phytohabitans rumicis]